jgi:LPS sulfotransferase NodH
MPVVSYIVCATPRSGSTLLCELLKSTGVAGNPEEYFEARAATGLPPHPGDHLAGLSPKGAAVEIDATPTVPPPYSDLRGIRDYAEHLERSFHLGTTANGVFGCKLMWRNLEDLRLLAGGLPEYAGLGVHELLERLFRSPRYVLVTRRDKVRQAISLWRALQTQTWRKEHAGAAQGDPELVFSYEAVDHLVRRLQADEAAWEEHLAAHAEQTVTVGYELDLERDREATVERVLRHLDVAVPAGWTADAALHRQADELTERWVGEFAREREQRSLPV